MNDQELAAQARRVGIELRARAGRVAAGGDRDRYAGWLLKELADRLDARAAAQPAEARGIVLPSRWPPMQPHGYDPDSHIPGRWCTYCGGDQDDPLHAAAGETGKKSDD